MVIILFGFIAVCIANKANMSDGFIIANAILVSSFAITDKLWDIKIRLNEIKDKLK